MAEFRILEYKDHFVVQKKYTENTYLRLFGVKLWINGKKENWNIILKNKARLDISNWKEKENWQFKTKQECLERISDYHKYPITHNL